jgi:hypothetical protein
MLTLDEIRERLRDRRLPVVSEATGVHSNTIRVIRDNPWANPTYQVMLKLSNYLTDKDVK